MPTDYPSHATRIKPTSPAEPSSEEKPLGYKSLSRRVVRRTTDLIAISILAIGGLSVGGQISQWWSTESEPPATTESPAGPPTPWGQQGEPVSIQLGEMPFVLERQSVHASHEKAAQLLLSTCRRLLESGSVFETIPGEAEKKLLAQVAGLEPIEKKPGAWSIYQSDLPLTTVIGTRQIPTVALAKVKKTGVGAQQRVVCWGVVFPQGKEAWTLLTLASSQQPAIQSGLPEILLPAECRRILSLKEATGTVIVGFEGEGSPELWRRHFDGWFEKQGWHLVRSWVSTETGWSARYRPRNENALGQVAIQLNRTGTTEWAGLLTSTTSPWQ